MTEQNDGAIWLNKRSLRALLFGFDHTLEPFSEGWRVSVTSPRGELVAEFVQGGQKTIALGAGDYLRASGDEIYVHRPSTRDDHGPLEPLETDAIDVATPQVGV